MSNVFISHRSSDSKLAERLAHDVRGAGHDVWIDLWNLTVGDQLVERISQGLTGANYLVLCYSADGVESPWISAEWASTLARQLNGERVKILPVRLSGTQAPAILAGTKYADLTIDWDRGVEELLKAIQ